MKTRRIVAILMAMVMLLGLAIPVAAAEADTYSPQIVNRVTLGEVQDKCCTDEKAGIGELSGCWHQWVHVRGPGHYEAIGYVNIFCPRTGVLLERRVQLRYVPGPIIRVYCRLCFIDGMF